jgi:chromosome partitioning protein
MAITISFINQKGGVGKTTSSVNTAAILAYKGYSVLLVDMDPQANTTGYYDMYDSEKASIYNVMLRGARVMEVVKQTPVKGLFILPSVLDFSRAELELSQILMRQEYVLKDALSFVSDSFDYILIDCPPARNKVTINALTASDYVVIPTIPDHFAIESITSMGELLNQVKCGVNPNLQVLVSL